MKRPVRAPSQLSESMHKRLSAYALAASAAGVGVLALAQPAEARVVYTPAHVKIGYPDFKVYRLDINHDGITDFLFSTRAMNTYQLNVCGPTRSESRPCLSTKGNHFNEIWGYKTGRFSKGFASALRQGARIAGDPKHFLSQNFIMASVTCGEGSCGTARGPWAKANGNNRYLGLKFVVKGKVHYGWARVNVVAPPPDTRAILTGYAYETIPNKPIKAGQTHSEDQATLGRLAQGASGVRQK
jgi:hypothetical protein